MAPRSRAGAQAPRLQAGDPVMMRVQDGVRDALSRLVTPSKWIPLELGPKFSEWPRHGTLSVRVLVGGIVEFRGLVKVEENLESTDYIVKIPGSACPSHIVIVNAASNAENVQVSIETDGLVHLANSLVFPSAGGWISMSSCGGYCIY